ncbi:MAG TPA: hypothetical protein VNT75_01700 [Symbiobacteriaceae bacterium]|nr:hypothetical protein [Symbiobacteriaceae bacterium]
MRNYVALLLVAALLAAGCARTTGKQFRQIVYSYTGGVAGFNQSMVIRSDGSFELADQGKSGKKGRLSSAEVAHLRQLVNAVAWSDIQEKYIDPRVADAIMEGLTVEIGKNKYATVVGTGAQPPSELGQLMGKLKQILDKQK